MCLSVEHFWAEVSERFLDFGFTSAKVDVSSTVSSKFQVVRFVQATRVLRSFCIYFGAERD